MGKNKKRNNNGLVQRNENNGIDILGVDARKLGTAVASVLVAEIANAAVQRLSRSTFGDSASAVDLEDVADSNDVAKDGSDKVSKAASRLGEQAANAELSAEDAVQKVRSSLGNVTLNLSDVVDVLRDAGQRLKEQSGGVVNASSDTVLNGIAAGATAVLERVTPDTQSDAGKPKKAAKHHKKKHKKKKH